MAREHTLEYSKTSSVKCQKCKQPIERGSLRYGHIINGEYGETIKWEHWGCVTPDVLRNLAAADLEHDQGFMLLKTADQNKVRQAMARGRVNDGTRESTIPVTGISSPSILSKNGEGSGQRHKRPLDPEVIEISDSEDEPIIIEDTKDELYCILSTQAVGLQYYRGLVGAGEEVTLVREPHNTYDRNAIRVLNISGEQVGHIPRGVAAKLSPLLDTRRVTVDGVMTRGNLVGKPYNIPMSIKIYGAAEQRAQLEPLLRWATPHQRGFPPPRPDGSRDIPGLADIPHTQLYDEYMISQSESGPLTSEEQRKLQATAESLARAEELRIMLANLERRDDESRRGSLLDKLCSTEDILQLPEHPNPPGVSTGELVVNLLKHQKQALQWCLDREYPKLPTKEKDKPVQFWQLKKTGNKEYYCNLATRSLQQAPPELGRGALCADGMGLGKTLTMIALILATKNDVPSDHSRATLIVVPLSVMSNWEEQIKEHCAYDALKTYVYYGEGRGIAIERLRKYDVVITTYQVVAKEHANLDKGQQSSKKKRKGVSGPQGLFGVKWKRVILDEGHNIRNSRTKMAQAVYALEAQRRWVLTGTPIINTPRDLGSLLTFLRICKPLDQEDYFKRMVLRPLKFGSPEGYQLLRAVMMQICIRRTKEMQDSDGTPLVPLPGVEMVTIPVKLDAAARDLYDRIEEASKQKFEALLNEEGGVTVPTNVLGMLTRLRQVALHTGLVPSNYLEELQSSITNDSLDKPGALIKINPKLKVKLQAILAQAIEDSQECPICFCTLEDPRITGCAHMFCLACIQEATVRNPKCPMDRRSISMDNLVEPPPPTQSTQQFPDSILDADEDEDVREGSSAKVDKLIRLLKLTPPNEKSLVFSQFTSFLDKIAAAFDEEGISYVRFTGKMSAKDRQETIEHFRVPISEESLMEPPSSPPLEPEPSDLRKSTRSREKDSIVMFDSDLESDGEDKNKDGDYHSDDSDVMFSQNTSDLIRDANKRDRKGKGRAKSKYNGLSFNNGSNPKVMLISLKAGALGLNLTVANNVYLMDPWWQEGIESQAIDRCNRIGQTKKVHVYQLIAENTVESKVLSIQEEKKRLISEAFSGIKNAETPRQKREARMKDMIELFGIRQRQASNRQT